MADENLYGHTVWENFSLSGIKTTLDGIISDTSKSKKKRKQVVHSVIDSQPYPTTEFSEYDEWNAAFGRKLDNGPIGIIGKAILPPPTLMLIILSAIDPSISNIFLAALFLSATVLFCFPSKQSRDHKIAYGDRAYMSAQEIAVKNAENMSIEEVSGEKGQFEHLTKKHSSKNSTISVVEAKQDYKDAFNRIISYELDISKAITYPALNDLTVKETSVMIRQMKKCERLKDSVTESTVDAFKDEVDELWVNILAAERRAKKIAHSGVTDAERKGLEQAQQLLVQIQDDANTASMRATFYEQLRRVVNRINADDDVVPAKIVKEIESTTARSIEAGTKNKDTVLLKRDKDKECDNNIYGVFL